jgi:hypothetical protein
MACSEVVDQKAATDVKRWLRHAENLSHKGKRSGKGLIDFQVGNEKGSVDLINCQVGRGDIPDFQVGKGEEMSSAESSHQRMLTDEEEAEGRPHSDGDSRGAASRVNEDDEKLQTSTIEEKDQGSILIIGGVEIFLPSGQGEASTDVADATGRQQAETVMEEEEQILMSVPTEGERPVELLTQWELELKALEDWLGNPEPEGGCQEIAMPEEIHQHELQLVEAGTEPVEKMTGVNLSEEVVERQFSIETAEVEDAVEWQVKATRDGEDDLGNQHDFPMNKEGMQQASLQKESQSIEQLDEVVEEIRKLMLESVEELVSMRKLGNRKPARAARMMQEQKQRSRGAERQLQEKVWDPGGFQPRWKAHEQELMIFIAMEYDAGASLHLSTRQSYFTHGAHLRKERHHPLIFPRESKARSRHLMKTRWKRKLCFRTSWR